MGTFPSLSWNPPPKGPKLWNFNGGVKAVDLAVENCAPGPMRIGGTNVIAVGALVWATGCMGTVDLLLKAPIEDKCKDAGLRGCADLTDGVVMYLAGGYREDATTKIKHGAAMNAPDDVREFATAIRALKAIPGADQYAGPLFAVADLLAIDDKRKAKANPKRRPAHADSELASVDDSDAEAMAVRKTTSRTSVPTEEATSYKCVLYGDTIVVGRCSTIATGPATVTDIQTAGGCQDQLLVGAGEPQTPTWVIAAQPNVVLSVHGADYIVDRDQSLFVAQAAPDAGAPSAGTACAITWSIHGPVSAPQKDHRSE
jgi:hypothetical protein